MLLTEFIKNNKEDISKNGFAICADKNKFDKYYFIYKDNVISLDLGFIGKDDGKLKLDQIVDIEVDKASDAYVERISHKSFIQLQKDVLDGLEDEKEIYGIPAEEHTTKHYLVVNSGGYHIRVHSSNRVLVDINKLKSSEVFVIEILYPL